MRDVKQFADAVFDAVSAWVSKSISALSARIDGLETQFKAIPAPRDGMDGLNGKDADPELIRAEVAKAVAAIPAPKDGKDGNDGKSITADEVRPMLEQLVKALPAPKDGRDGEDGKSITVADVLPLLETCFAKWAIEVERRAMDRYERHLASMPAPQNGKDGTDGIGFEDLDVQYDGERTVTLRFQRGERVKSFSFELPTVIDRGVFKDGQSYVKSDGVTWAGSFWIAQRATDAKPGLPDSGWRLAVKSGRDGKDMR